jgi:serine/threonine protein kinase
MFAPDTILQNRYRILRKLGQGGMGTVYLAEDRRFGSKVALKEARFERDDARRAFERDDARRAFEREAGLLNRLRHPALPVVMDYFTEAQGQYLIMQFIPGSDLEELLVERLANNRGPFPIGQALAWADRLLDALEYLHGHEPPIIHRDIKPQNLKLTPRGEVVLLDFGLAKGAASEMSQSGESLHGYSRHYAPLEQMSGKGTDARSDLYSLAATMHRLVTGEIPPDAMARRAATASGQADPLRPANELNPQIPAEVTVALSCALAQNPDGRPATAKEMRQALRQSSATAAQSDSDSIVISERQSQIESSVPPDEESGLVATRSESTAKLGSTYAGQTTPVIDSRLAAALRPEEVSKLSARRRPRVVWAGVIAMSVLIFVIAAVAFRNENQRSTPPSPPARVEVMSYSLMVEANGGETRLLANDKPLASGQRFKLRFTPKESGYLYIIAPNAKEIPTTFLTAQPNPDWGVETNRVDAGADYNFPPKQDSWLRITGDAESETYLVVFAPTLLSTPGFLAEPAGRELTNAEQRELESFRERNRTEVSAERSGNQSVVIAPRERSTGAPLIFETKVKRRIGQ